MGAKPHAPISQDCYSDSIVDMFVDVSAGLFGSVVFTNPIGVLEDPDHVIFDKLGILFAGSAVCLEYAELFTYLLQHFVVLSSGGRLKQSVPVVFRHRR